LKKSLSLKKKPLLKKRKGKKHKKKIARKELK